MVEKPLAKPSDKPEDRDVMYDMVSMPPGRTAAAP